MSIGKVSRQGRMLIGGAVVGALAAPALAQAQCADWRVRGSGLRVNGYVYASTLWDVDGDGPRPPVLIVGGQFTRAGGTDGIAVSNVAAWDGVEWIALGAGLGGEDNAVFSLAVSNGQLVAGGDFTTSGGEAVNRIARWNGIEWVQIGAGFDGGVAPGVHALSVFNGELIAGGRFTASGAQPANGIARYNGVDWQPLASGIQGEVHEFPPTVASMTVFGSGLIVGGVFTTAGGQSANCVARWNGSTWQPLGSGMGSPASDLPFVSSLEVYNGWLVAGGEFTTAGGQAANCIARWNGSSWLGIGSGISGGSSPGVYDMEIYNGDLVVSGRFSGVSGTSALNIARWNGATWMPLGTGVGPGCADLCVFNNELVAGGGFLFAGNERVRSLARWNGAEWRSMPGVLRPSGTFGVRTITPWGGSVVLGGYYPTTDTNLAAYSHSLTAWDGWALRPLGTPNSIVLASVVEPADDGGTELVVAGQFDAIDSVPFGSVARLNEAPGSGWQPMGAGFDDWVTALTRFNGSTYATGYFHASGSTPLNYIARWDGAAWQPVGPGLTSGLNLWGYCMKGYSAGPDELSLVVGGAFTSAGGVGAARIASFNVNTRTNATSWTKMGDGFNEAVRAIEYYNGSIYAAGDFTASGDSHVRYIARWNGDAWEPVGGGLSGPARAMTVYNGALIVGGHFMTADGQTVDRLARWDGKEWTRVGGGVNGPVYSLNTFQNELHVGGEFTRARLNVLESPLWARYSQDGIPWFAEQPAPQAVDCRGDASFHILPALGYGGLDYLWRKNGVPLILGPTGTGSTIVTNGTNLHVLNANETDAGTYDCVLSNGCGGTTSVPATLTVNGDCPPCFADLNSDGTLNSQDFFDFLTAFFAAAAVADFNHDDVINSQDFFDYLAAFFAGC